MSQTHGHLNFLFTKKIFISKSDQLIEGKSCNNIRFFAHNYSTDSFTLLVHPLFCIHFLFIYLIIFVAETSFFLKHRQRENVLEIAHIWVGKNNQLCRKITLEKLYPTVTRKLVITYVERLLMNFK